MRYTNRHPKFGLGGERKRKTNKSNPKIKSQNMCTKIKNQTLQYNIWKEFHGINVKHEKKKNPNVKLSTS